MPEDGIDCILRHCTEHFIRQMRNWAWANSGGMGFAISSAYDGMVRDTYDGPAMPVLLGEAGDVDRGLERLPLRERSAVMIFWQFEGRPLRWLGRRMQVDHHTAKRRILTGHELLQAELTRQRAAQRRIADLNAATLSAP